jgi:hypothetical protein
LQLRYNNKERGKMELLAEGDIWREIIWPGVMFAFLVGLLKNAP